MTKVLESLDETVYHLYSNNEDRAKTRVIETATSVLGLANVMPSDCPPAAAAVPEMPTLQVCNKTGQDRGDGDDDGGDEKVSKRWYGLHVCHSSPSAHAFRHISSRDLIHVLHSPQTTASPDPTRPTGMQLPPTAKRSNVSVSRSLHDSFSTLRVGDDERSAESSTCACTDMHGAVLCTQPPDDCTSPMSMRSVVDESQYRTDEERIRGVILYLRLQRPKTSVPLSIDILRAELPALGPMIAELLPEIDDNTYATLERRLDCDNEAEGERLDHYLN